MPRPPVHSTRIAEDIRRRILSGELRPGMPMPGRRELAEHYDVAVLTLQRALAPLLKDGTLRSESTRGTYVSEVSARGQTGRHLRVAILAQSEVDPGTSGTDGIWSARAVRSCESVLSAAGTSTRFYNVMHHTRRWWPTPMAALQAAADEEADAIIAINPAEAGGWVDALAAFRPGWSKPLVYACGDSAPPGLSTVRHDQEESGASAAQHCLAAGYRRLVALRPYEASWLDHRIAGARRIAGRRLQVVDGAKGMSVQEFWDKPPVEQVRLLAKLIRDTLQDPSSLAIISPSDGVARDLLPTIEAADIQLGSDVGLIGFDDTPVARNEGLTTMAPPLEELGAAAARSCLLALRGGDTVRQILVPSRLIARASTFLPANRARA